MQPSKSVEIQFRLHPASRALAPGTKRSEPSAAPPAQGRLPRITQLLALAIQFQEIIRRGEARDYAELGRLGGLCRERISQIMKLIWLAPDIQMEVLFLPPVPGGRCPVSETALRKVAGHLDWGEQREEWLELKKAHHVN